MKKIAFILALFITVFGKAQVDEDQKIGLVLSGGGAKGFAHIGVLKVIDSLGLKVDYIAGTSMGAVIGALYASGYTGKQLDSIFNGVDFDRLINDRIPRNDKSFFARRNEERYAVSLPFDDFKVQLPSAISRGQNVFNLLSKLTLHVSGTENFEELPIPFFCIATDIETGEAVVLDKGSLPKAIVASGAFPSLFQPVKMDGRLLIDGGVVNNYPIDELKVKGMDIIVGVDVQDDLADRKELVSATGILLQINNFRTIRDMVTKSKKTDVYIKPDIEEFTVISFSEGSKIIENGKIAALQKINELKRLAVKQDDSGKYNKIPKAADSIKIRNIILSGRSGYPRSYVLGKLKIKENEKISLQDFERGINRLVATDNFESLRYIFNPVPEGYDLRMDAARSENSASIKLAVHYDDLYKSAALINFSKKRLLFSNDALALDFILGDNVRYNFDYFVDKGFYWSIGLHSRYNTFHKNINPLLLLSQDEVDVAGLNRIDVELSDFTNRIYLQTLFRRDFSFLLGGEHKRLKITSETLAEGEDLTAEQERTFEKSDFFSLFAGLKFDTFSNKYFPKKGFLFDGDVHWYLTSSDFNNNFSPFAIAKADIAYVIKFSSKLSTRIGSSGGFKLGEDSNNSLNFALGGYGNDLINNFVPFLGYDFISITGNSYVKGYIDLDLEWLPKNHILLSANFSNTGDDIFEDGEWFTDPDFTGYALGYGIESFLGPLEVKYSWSPETESGIWFFNLGFWF